MMDSNKGKKVTVQGRDTPVPVGSVGVRTGHTRSSTSDCPNQAREENDKQVEEIMDDIPFRVGSKVIRSPIKKAGRTASCSDISDINKEVNKKREAEAIKKRKRSKSSDPGGEGSNNSSDEEEALEHDIVIDQIQKLIGELGKEVEIISEVAKERNTKREVKEAAGKLKFLLLEFERINVVDNIERDSEKISKLRKENRELRKTIRELKSDQQQKAVEEEMLSGEISYDNFKEMEHLRWPEDVFRAAFPAMGPPTTVRKEVDHLVIYEEGEFKKTNEGILKTYEERYPELGEMEEREGALKIDTRVLTSEGDTAYNDRWILWSVIGDSMEEWYRVLESVKGKMASANRKKLSVYPPGFDERGDITRKMLEYLFRGTDIMCLLHSKAQSTRKQANQGDTQGKPRRDDALIVSQGGKTYKDILKVLKEKVKPDSTAAKAVKTIREARDGKMIIVLNKDGGAAVDFRK